MAGWTTWLQAHREELERASPYQWLFARTVLALTPGLSPVWVSTEHPFIDAHGGARRMDFAVQRPDGLRLAIEVDGYDKTGTGSGMSPGQFQDFLLRQNSLTNQGWQLLRFANTQVRDDPAGCRAQLAEALRAHNRRPAQAAPEPLEPPEPPDLSGREAPRRPGQASTSKSTRTALVMAAIVVAVAAVIGVAVAGSGSDSSSASSVAVAPDGQGRCPSSHPVKANERLRGGQVTRIAHVPGQRFYDRTRAERCYRTLQDAESAGYRASEV